MFKSNKILRTSTGTGTPRSPDPKSNKILQIARTSTRSWSSSPWAEKNSQAQSHAQAQDAGARTSTPGTRSAQK
jgi:hypothetical protein